TNPVNNSTHFAHLHVHTEYSFLDGAARTDKIFSEAYEKGISALAITDHGSMFGVYEFVKRAVKHTDPKADFFKFMKERRPFRVKPIIGCEVYVCPNRHVKQTVGGRAPKLEHLVLLAKNEKGYKNLIKICSMGYVEGFYYKPRIDMEILRKYAEGLICLSGCLAGPVCRALMNGEMEKADAIADELKALFQDDFYIELQDHGIMEQKQVNPLLITLAKKKNIKLVATNDVHYLKKSDSKMQKVLQCIAFRETLDTFEGKQSGGMDGEQRGRDDYFPTDEFYLKNRSQMEELFSHIPDAISNTLEIAEKCEPYFFTEQSLYPTFITPDGTTVKEYLKKVTYDGLQKKYPVLTDEIKERADYELRVVDNMGFNDYYLVVNDFIQYAHQNDISVGPGRGSGVGSIIAYSLDITRVDPLKYGLLFERFLNPDRVSPPDFDIDFCVERRDEVIDYVVEKYGSLNVCQIVTFGTLAPKAAIKDVGRVVGKPYSEVDRLSKLVPFMMGKLKLRDILGQTNERSMVIAELKEMYENDESIKELLDMAIKVEGLPRQTGIHAAGVIICSDEVHDHIPLAKTTDNIITTQFDMNECQELGLLKMDFLGLRTLTDIKKAIDMVKKNHNVDIDFYNMDYDDAKVFEMFGDGDTHAIFQFESEGMKRFMKDLKPTSLEDIIAGVALYRPGPMDKIPLYVKNKKLPSGVTYDHAKLEDILQVTYGVCVYQEQVMQIVQTLAGYTLARADELRRIMGKKKVEAMNKEKEVFLFGTTDEKGNRIPGCVENGVNEKIATKIFNDLEAFSSYAFNKSHAAAYAYLAYQTAYLKYHYPLEFICAVLNNRISNIDEIQNYLTYLKQKGFKLYPPDINRSLEGFSVHSDGDGVVMGLAGIKNIGEKAVVEIIKEREARGAFSSFVDFADRVTNAVLNKKVIEGLVFSGSFDSTKKTRAALLKNFPAIVDRASKEKAAKEAGQFSFFDMGIKMTGNDYKFVECEEMPQKEMLEKEKEFTGVYLSSHPLDEYEDFLEGFEINTSAFSKSTTNENEEIKIIDGGRVRLGGMVTAVNVKTSKAGKEFAIVTIEDLHGSLEAFAGGIALATAKTSAGKIVTIEGSVREDTDRFSLWIDKIISDTATQKLAQKTQPKKVCFTMSLKNTALLDELQEILLFYQGNDETYIKNTDDGKFYPLRIKTELSEHCLSELFGAIGEENVQIVSG
ncbi:MAG: DNA polymerase III subunit alpha, partial [Firmicutes bacterium]|nr:DNA polymerase III subunit alpha [Bacillota bacterium]